MPNLNPNPSEADTAPFMFGNFGNIMSSSKASSMPPSMPPSMHTPPLNPSSSPSNPTLAAYTTTFETMSLSPTGSPKESPSTTRNNNMSMFLSKLTKELRLKPVTSLCDADDKLIEDVARAVVECKVRRLNTQGIKEQNSATKPTQPKTNPTAIEEVRKY